jgi:hypothetical protein
MTKKKNPIEVEAYPSAEVGATARAEESPVVGTGVVLLKSYPPGPYDSFFSCGDCARITCVESAEVGLTRCSYEDGTPLSMVERTVPLEGFWDHFARVTTPAKTDIGASLSALLQQAKAKHQEVYQSVEQANRRIQAVEETLKEVLGSTSVRVDVSGCCPNHYYTAQLGYDGKTKKVIVWRFIGDTEVRNDGHPFSLLKCSADLRLFFSSSLEDLVREAMNYLEKHKQDLALNTAKQKQATHRQQIPGSGLTSTEDWRQPAYSPGCHQTLADEILNDPDGVIAASSARLKAEAERCGFDLDQALAEMGILDEHK